MTDALCRVRQVGRISLMCHHGIREEAMLGCQEEDGGDFGGSESFEESWFECAYTLQNRIMIVSTIGLRMRFGHLLFREH